MHDAARGKPTRVTIGMPVYNGERFLAEAIESVLRQSYRDLTLIISDNASGDGTEAICRRYAAEDPRVQYVRRDENCGAVPNFNSTFQLSRSEYFKWQCADDAMAPDLVGEAVEALDREPEVVLAYHRAKIIDDRGDLIGTWADGLDMHGGKPHQRLHQFLYKRNKGHLESQFGLYRTSIFRRTTQLPVLPHGDQILIAEMAMHGPLRELPGEHFYRRFHSGISTEAHSLHELSGFLDTRRKNRVSLLRFERLFEFVRAVNRVGLPLDERLRCYAELRGLVLTTESFRRVAEDLIVAGTNLWRNKARRAS